MTVLCPLAHPLLGITSLTAPTRSPTRSPAAVEPASLRAAKDAEAAAAAACVRLNQRLAALEAELAAVGAELRAAEAERLRRREEIATHAQRTAEQVTIEGEFAECVRDK